MFKLKRKMGIKPHFKRFFLSKPRNILIHAFNIFWQLKHLSLYYQHLFRFSIKPERCIHSHSIFQFSVLYCTWIRMFNVFGLLPVFLNVLFATLSYVIWFESTYNFFLVLLMEFIEVPANILFLSWTIPTATIIF